MKKIILSITVITLMIFLSSCQVDDNDQRTGEKVLITHTVSKVVSRDEEGNVVEAYQEEVSEYFYINPKRVVTFNLGVADIFLYLGLDTLGITKFGLPKDGNPLAPSLSFFNDKTYSDTGTLFIPNYDVLDLFNPELIILDGRVSNEYENLKKRYPNSDVLDLSLTTYAFEKHQKNLETLGKLFPSAKETLDDLIIDFNNKFSDIRTKTGDYRLLFIQLNGEVISVATGENGRYGLVYKEFGFIPADLAASDKSENNHGTMGANFEYIKEINPEVIFVMDRNMIVSGQASDDFTKEPLIKDVLAVKNDHIYYLDPTSWYTISGGITATYQMISDVMQFINKLDNE